MTFAVPNNPPVIIAGNGGAQTFVQRALMPLRVRGVIVDALRGDVPQLEATSLQVGDSEQLMRPIALPLLELAELDFTWPPDYPLAFTVVNYMERSVSVRFALNCFRMERSRRVPPGLHSPLELSGPPTLERVVVPLELSKGPT